MNMSSHSRTFNYVCRVGIAHLHHFTFINKVNIVFQLTGIFFWYCGSLMQLFSVSLCFVAQKSLELSANYTTLFSPVCKFIINMLISTYTWGTPVVTSLPKLTIYSWLNLLRIHEKTFAPTPGQLPCILKVTLHKACNLELVILGTISSSGSNLSCDLGQSFT